VRFAVIGTGVMGKSIAGYLSLFEQVKSISWLGSRKGKSTAEMSSLSRIIKRISRKHEANCSNPIEKIKPIDSFSDLVGVDFLIEAVTENFDSKKAVFTNFREHLSDDTIVVSNTSSVSITRLAAILQKPERVIGIHFFNPIEFMELVEVIQGFHTSSEVIKKAREFLALINKKTVLINETPGFIVNRMLIPMINEAITLLSEGAACKEDIDIAMKYGANHPIGPLSLSDLIGNDVVLSIMQTLFEETSDPKYRPHPLLIKMVRAGALGRKTKNGFYSY